MSHTIQFLGATRQVTGSKYLLNLHDQYILVDCGIDLEDDNPDSHPFGFDPRSIDHVLLTHAHIDHSGLIPLLVKEGFEGMIYCTYATYHLTRLLLFDMARINQRKEDRNRKKPRHFFRSKDVERCLDFFHPMDFDEPTPLSEDVTFTFKVAGHLLGAAHIMLNTSEGKSIIFSGDIGRKNYPLLKDPEPLSSADCVICESTYGLKTHEDKEALKIIKNVIFDSCVEIPGRLIIPTFSVGRTQSLLFILHQLQVQGDLPAITIFTDSPLGKKSTQVYQDFVSFMNDNAVKFNESNGTLFDFDNLIYLEDMNSAEEIDQYNKPCIIITSSGMVKGGKSQDHIMRNMGNSYCTILFIGYCAEGTMGRRLLDGMKSFRRGDEEITVHAKILKTDALSGHCDFNGLMDFFKKQDKALNRKIFLVHGEHDAMENFRSSLVHEGHNQVIIPEYGQRFDLFD